jgi:hypothetical protein
MGTLDHEHSDVFSKIRKDFDAANVDGNAARGLLSRPAEASTAYRREAETRRRRYPTKGILYRSVAGLAGLVLGPVVRVRRQKAPRWLSGGLGFVFQSPVINTLGRRFRAKLTAGVGEAGQSGSTQ